MRHKRQCGLRRKRPCAGVAIKRLENLGTERVVSRRKVVVSHVEADGVEHGVSKGFAP